LASRRDRSDAGFSLIELLIVVAVMPLVVGAIAIAMLSVFSLYPSVSNRVSDSADAQLVGLNFQTDVQSASLITTDGSSTSPTPCGSGYQVLGLQQANGMEISYMGSAGEGTAYKLTRNVCTNQTVSTSAVLARDLPQTFLQSAVTVTCSQTNPPAGCAPTPPSNMPGYAAGWVSTLGITGVDFTATAPASAFKYEFKAVPAASTSSTNLTAPSTPLTGCGLATPGTGTYDARLCFVDFTPWNASPQMQATGVSCPANLPSPASPWFAMSANVGSTPFVLSFCMSVSATASGGGAITGPTSAGPACGVAARNGSYDLTAVPLPTYSCPPGSEAFLGNNGFYTGVNGFPGLYTVDQGSIATVQFTNIQVVSASGQAANNWELVSGDAESTDSGESITWSSNQVLNLLPNSPLSPVGNACNSTPPSYNASSLTGLGTTTVKCFNSPSEDHTGTAMMEAATPTSLTVTLDGGGLQATFLGVLLP
jgi:type II secretory pathway pseudopilin PulG